MADKQEPERAQQKKDTAEYSAAKAPETRKEAEEPPQYSDIRLKPGGPDGSPADVGMSGIDRDVPPHGARRTGQERYGETPDEGKKEKPE